MPFVFFREITPKRSRKEISKDCAMICRSRSANPHLISMRICIWLREFMDSYSISCVHSCIRLGSPSAHGHLLRIMQYSSKIVCLRKAMISSPVMDLFYGREDDLNCIAVFGCDCYAFEDENCRQDKLSPRALKLTYVGNVANSTAFKLADFSVAPLRIYRRGMVGFI